MEFRDRIALVTGGSSGIGLATARLPAAHGAYVWPVARDPSRLVEAQTFIARDGACAGGQCQTIIADVADPDQAARVVHEVTEQAGASDLVVNSAGIAYPGYFLDLDLAAFRQTMDENYFGTVHVVKAAVPGMIERGSGHSVNICSLAGLIGVFGYTAYGASKFAVRGFSDALRAELNPLGIGVSVVFPPDTDTPQLAFENEFKPLETRALAGGAQVLSADELPPRLSAASNAGNT